MALAFTPFPATNNVQDARNKCSISFREIERKSNKFEFHAQVNHNQANNTLNKFQAICHWNQATRLLVPSDSKQTTAKARKRESDKSVFNVNN